MRKIAYKIRRWKLSWQELAALGASSRIIEFYKFAKSVSVHRCPLGIYEIRGPFDYVAESARELIYILEHLAARIEETTA